MADVALENVSKNFGKKEILKDINLKINDGEFIVLVGASGCGKSTLLRLISGLEKQTQGSIYIDDKKVDNIHPKDRDIAMVFQSYALYPHLNVKDNIALGLKVRHCPKCEINRRTKNALEILQLEDYVNSRPKELSGGQRQRVALARAIVREPKVFLMDEPLSNLDAKLRNQMRYEIKKLHNKLNATFIYVTHDQTEALTMGDRIVVLNDGKIQQIDTPYNIYHYPQNVFVATFMGANPMNIIEADIVDGFMHFGNISIDITTLPKKVQKLKKVLLGIRAEDLMSSLAPAYHFNLIKFSAKIEFEENLGSNKNVYFNLKDKEFCVNMPSKVILNSNTVDLSLDVRNLYYFDFKTKENLFRKNENIEMMI